MSLIFLLLMFFQPQTPRSTEKWGCINCKKPQGYLNYEPFGELFPAIPSQDQLKPSDCYNGHTICHVIQEKSPIDVPPIQEEYGEPGYLTCDLEQCVWTGADGWTMNGHKPTRRTRESCTEKTRFLMTSEDGIKHCIRLETK